MLIANSLIINIQVLLFWFPHKLALSYLLVSKLFRLGEINLLNLVFFLKSNLLAASLISTQREYIAIAILDLLGELHELLLIVINIFFNPSLFVLFRNHILSNEWFSDISRLGFLILLIIAKIDLLFICDQVWDSITFATRLDLVGWTSTLTA